MWWSVYANNDGCVSGARVSFGFSIREIIKIHRLLSFCSKLNRASVQCSGARVSKLVDLACIVAQFSAILLFFFSLYSYYHFFSPIIVTTRSETSYCGPVRKSSCRINCIGARIPILFHRCNRN